MARVLMSYNESGIDVIFYNGRRWRQFYKNEQNLGYYDGSLGLLFRDGQSIRVDNCSHAIRILAGSLSK